MLFVAVALTHQAQITAIAQEMQRALPQASHQTRHAPRVACATGTRVVWRNAAARAGVGQVRSGKESAFRGSSLCAVVVAGGRCVVVVGQSVRARERAV